MMNAAYAAVAVLLMVNVIVMETLMLVVVVVQLVLQAVIMPVAQQLYMMNAVYVMVITHPALVVLIL